MDDALAGYWPSPWPAEDGGPLRRQTPHGGGALDLRPGDQLSVVHRDVPGATMLSTGTPASCTCWPTPSAPTR